MISARPALLHLGFSVESPLRAVQEVREQIVNAKSPLTEAASIVFKVAGLEKKFDDITTAIHIAQHIVVTFVQNESYDEELAYSEAVKRDEAIRKALPWAFEKAEPAAKRGETTSSVIEGIDVQVAVTSSGKIKKGGRAILAEALYAKHVLELDTPITQKEFVKMLVKQVGMTQGGASTYAGNCKKKLGGAFTTA